MKRVPPLLYIIIVLLVATAAGLFGSLLGLGGGIIVIPVLTLFLGVDHAGTRKELG
jgi:uncharacterized membrane protein YfcA